MRAPLWPTELSRRSTPPGARTRNRSLRRRLRFPLCASGVRLSKESNPAQCRPGDSNPASFRGKSPVPVLSGASGKVGHLGVEPSATALSGRPLRPAGSWPAEDGGVEPRGLGPPQAFRARCRAGGASSIPARRAADSNRNAVTPIRIRNGARNPGGFTLHKGSPPGVNGPRKQRTENSNLTPQGHPVSNRGQPPGWFILHEQKAADSNGTVLPAHPLATEPGSSPDHLP